MGVGEDRAVGFDESRMPGHAEIRLHVHCRMSARVQQAEVKEVRRAGGEAGRPVPDHGVAVRELVRGANFPGAQRCWKGARIFSVERPPGQVGRDVHRGDQGLREAAGVDDVAVQFVVSRRHGGQAGPEVAFPCQRRMQVKGGVHLRPADRVQVHHLAVVQQVVIVGPGLRRA